MLKVKATSSAVSSVPSWKRTPLRNWKVQFSPSAETTQVSAKAGMGSSRSLNSTRPLNMRE